MYTIIIIIRLFILIVSLNYSFHLNPLGTTVCEQRTNGKSIAKNLYHCIFYTTVFCSDLFLEHIRVQVNAFERQSAFYDSSVYSAMFSFNDSLKSIYKYLKEIHGYKWSNIISIALPIRVNITRQEYPVIRFTVHNRNCNLNHRMRLIFRSAKYNWRRCPEPLIAT